MTPRVTASDERFAQVGELELCWQEFGEQGNPPLLMVMGLGAQMILWPDEMCEMIAARGFRVIRFDNRDAGRSTILEDAPTGTVPRALGGEIEPGSYILSDMAADAAGLLDALGIEAAHVVGASLGGMIAQTLAVEHPQRVMSLASIMSTTGEPSVGHPTQAGLEALTTQPPRDRDGYVDALIGARRKIGSPGFPFDEERSRRIAALGWDRGYHPKGTVRQTIAIIGSGDRTERLARIAVPTVVIHGEVDPLIDVSGGRATAAAIPGAKLVVIPGMGHDFPAGVWERVAKEIAENAGRVQAVSAT
ncbi:MAG: alpha/beta fold hydrolase [Actinomycetota bacterium]|nr:alpha/beta fold hydrolase [Actinomycetota bacterium]